MNRRPRLGVLTTQLRAAPHTTWPCEPSPLPAPAVLAGRAQERIGRLREAWHGLGYGRAVAAARRYWTARFAEMIAGFVPARDAPFTLDDLVTGGLPHRHRRLFTLIAPALEREGVLRGDDGGWRFRPPSRTPRARMRELVRAHPQFAGTLALYAHHLQSLQDSWADGRDVLEALASDSTARMLEQYYDVMPVCRFHNQLAQALVHEVVRAWPRDRPLRVLEVGAGTGGTTAAVLPLLPADRTRYTYTDVSPYFLARAEHRFAAHDFVDYATFDLNQDVTEQNLTPGGFDLVIASNALHTAADLRQALRRVRTLLAPGGQLLGVETHDPEPLALLFGALDSFYAQTDHDLRPECLLLPRDRWPRLLTECGFTSPVRTGDDRAPARDQFSVFLTAAPAAPAPAAPVLPAVPEGTAHLIAVEQDGELPLARALADTLADRGAVRPRVVPLPRRHEEWDAVLLPETAAARPAGTTVVTVLLGDEAPAGPDGTVASTVRRLGSLGALAAARATSPGGTGTELWLVTRPCGALPAMEEITHPTRDLREREGEAGPRGTGSGTDSARP